MDWRIAIMEDGSMDPYFKVSVSCREIGIKNSVVEVVRRPPKVTFSYSEELKKHLDQLEQKKLELEILNKIAKYIISR